MRRFAWSSVRRHPLRTLATALSVVFGVAFVTGTFMFTDTVRAAFDELFGATIEGADVVVRSAAGVAGGGAAGVPPDLADRLGQIEGVEAAEARYRGFAKLASDTGEPLGGFGALLQGVDAPDAPIGPTLRSGAMPTSERAVAIDAASAEQLGKTVGDEAALLLNGPEQTYTISGIVEPPSGVEELAGSTTIVFSNETARRLYGAQGATYISVVAGDRVDATELRDTVQSRVGDDYQAMTADELVTDSVAQVGDFLGFLTQGLLVFAGAALLVGAIIIFNTFAITVAQRTREFALVQAVGADGRQVLYAVLLEAGLVGVVGSVIGVVTGALGALGLRSLLAVAGMPLPTTSLTLTPRTVIVGLLVGPGIAVLAALGPALRASRRAPVDALRDASPGHPASIPTARMVAGTLAAGVATSSLVGTALDRGGLIGLGIGAVSLTAAIVLLSPAVAGPLTGAIGVPVRALRALPGTLARANAVRNPGRTAATAMALLIGLALVTFVLVLVSSFRSSLDRVVVERFRADYQVQALDQLGYPAALTERVREVDGVASVSAAKVVRTAVDGTPRTAFAVEPATLPAVLDIDVLAGDLAALSEGGVVVSQDLGVEIGDEVAVQLATQTSTRRVVGVMEDLHLPGTTRVGQVLVDRAATGDALASTPDLVGLVRVADGVDRDRVRTALEEVVAAQPDARLADTAQLRAQVRDQANQLLGLVVGLVLLSVVVAFVGVVNILGLSVAERSPELGLLQALGMTPHQAREMVRWESVIITVLGTTVGLMLGLLFGWLGVRVLRSEGLVAFSVPLAQIALAVVVMLVAGVGASVLPARRASTVDVVHAVTVE